MNYWTGLGTQLGLFWRSLDERDMLTETGLVSKMYANDVNIARWEQTKKSNTRSLLNEFLALSLARSVNLFTKSHVIRWKITRSEKRSWKKKTVSTKEVNKTLAIERSEEEKQNKLFTDYMSASRDRRQKSSEKVKQGKHTYVCVNTRVNVCVRLLMHVWVRSELTV